MAFIHFIVIVEIDKNRPFTSSCNVEYIQDPLGTDMRHT